MSHNNHHARIGHAESIKNRDSDSSHPIHDLNRQLAQDAYGRHVSFPKDGSLASANDFVHKHGFPNLTIDGVGKESGTIAGHFKSGEPVTLRDGKVGIEVKGPASTEYRPAQDYYKAEQAQKHQ